MSCAYRPESLLSLFCFDRGCGNCQWADSLPLGGPLSRRRPAAVARAAAFSASTSARDSPPAGGGASLERAPPCHHRRTPSFGPPAPSRGPGQPALGGPRSQPRRAGPAAGPRPPGDFGPCLGANLTGASGRPGRQPKLRRVNLNLRLRCDLGRQSGIESDWGPAASSSLMQAASSGHAKTLKAATGLSSWSGGLEGGRRPRRHGTGPGLMPVTPAARAPLGCCPNRPGPSRARASGRRA